MSAALPGIMAQLIDAQPPRLALDTNVVMALWHFKDPRLNPLQRWMEVRNAVLLTRGECLDELQRVLAYEQFNITPAQQAQILACYGERSWCLPDQTPEQAEAATSLPQCRDQDDQKFLHLALDGAAHALLTRDKLLLGLARRLPFRERCLIMTPERLQTALAIGQ